MLPGIIPPLLLKGASKGALAFRSETSNRVAATSVTVNTPSGTAVGDLIVAILAQFVNKNAPTLPSGWTLLGSDSSLANDRCDVAIYQVTGTPPASHTFTYSASTDLNGTLLTFANADTAEIGTFQAAASGASTVAPSMTPTRNGILITSYASTQSARTPSTTPGSTTLISSQAVARPVEYVYQDNAASVAGVATGTRSATWSAGSRAYSVLINVEQLP